MFHAYWNKCKPAPLDMKEPWRRTSITSPANIMLQCFDGFIGIASKLVQQRDEAAADNGTRSVVAGSLESGTIADAETYHTRIAQVHIVYLLEIRPFAGIEVFLSSGCSSRRNHVDEAVGVCVNLSDALFAGFRGDEHDDAQVVVESYVLVTGFVVAEGQIGYNDSVNAASHTLAAECVEAILHDRVEISHENEGNMYVAPDVLQLLKQESERHAVAQGTGGGILNDYSIGHGVAEGNAYFYHVHAVLLQGADNVSGIVKGGAACAEVHGQQVVWIVLEKLVYSVHGVNAFG